MNAKLPNTASTDPDDAPELTDEFFANGTWQIAGKTVARDAAKAAIKQRGRPAGTFKAAPKVATTIRLSPEVIIAFKAGGDGWQTRIDAALKDWLKQRA